MTTGADSCSASILEGNGRSNHIEPPSSYCRLNRWWFTTSCGTVCWEFISLSLWIFPWPVVVRLDFFVRQHQAKNLGENGAWVVQLFWLSRLKHVETSHFAWDILSFRRLMSWKRTSRAGHPPFVEVEQSRRQTFCTSWISGSCGVGNQPFLRQVFHVGWRVEQVQNMHFDILGEHILLITVSHILEITITFFQRTITFFIIFSYSFQIYVALTSICTCFFVPSGLPEEGHHLWSSNTATLSPSLTTIASARVARHSNVSCFSQWTSLIE